MAKKTTAPTHESIIQDVRAGKIAPIYYLMGEESYYIDRIADFLVDHLLAPEERDFNLTTLFGAETDVDTIFHAALSFPMGGSRVLVLVREAQGLKQLEKLESYLKQAPSTTVLIFCHKNGSLDKRKAIAKQIEKVGVLYESVKLRDYQLSAWIKSYAQRKKISIAPDAAEMLATFVGADLNRLASELDKLQVALTSEGGKVISRELVQEHIGVSKNFNVFELTEALGRKDVFKANQIADHFSKNPKQHPIQVTLPVLFRFYSQLMLAYYAPNKTPQGIANCLGISEWQAERNLIPAMRKYTARKVMEIIAYIRQTDAKSKGVDNPNTPSKDLMKELLFFALH